MPISFNFVLEGFRLIRARPKLILFWGLVSLLGNGLSMLIVVASIGALWQKLQTVLLSHLDQAHMTAQLTALMPQMASASPAMLCTVPVNLITQAILICAVCRAAFATKDDRFGFLRLGWREVQVFVVGVAMFALLAAIMMMILTVASALGPVAGTVLGLFGGIGVLVWVQVRLSLNRVQSFDAQRIDIFGSFALTRGYFWPLLGGYIAAGGLALVVYFLGGQLASALVMLAFGGPALKLAAPDLTSMQSFLTPATVADFTLTYALIYPLVLAILIGAPVAAYRIISGKMTIRTAPEAF